MKIIVILTDMEIIVKSIQTIYRQRISQRTNNLCKLKPEILFEIQLYHHMQLELKLNGSRPIQT